MLADRKDNVRPDPAVPRHRRSVALDPGPQLATPLWLDGYAARACRTSATTARETFLWHSVSTSPSEFQPEGTRAIRGVAQRIQDRAATCGMVAEEGQKRKTLTQPSGRRKTSAGLWLTTSSATAKGNISAHKKASIVLAERVSNADRSGEVSLRRPDGLRLSPSPRQTTDVEALPKRPALLSRSSTFTWQLSPPEVPAFRGNRRVQKGSGSSDPPVVSQHQPHAGRGMKATPCGPHRPRPRRHSTSSVGWHRSAGGAPAAPDRRGGFRPLKQSGGLGLTPSPSAFIRRGSSFGSTAGATYCAKPRTI